VLATGLAACEVSTGNSVANRAPSGGQSSAAAGGFTLAGQPVSISIGTLTDPAQDSGGYNCSVGCTDHFATIALSVTNEGNSSITLPLIVDAVDQNGLAHGGTLTDPGLRSLCGGNPVGSGLLLPGNTTALCEGYVLPVADTVSKIEVATVAGSGSGSEIWSVSESVSDTFAGWSAS
jgi:hypothetical protein